ncbi:plastocyanin/azurin family copper-binding protein [Halosimplex marinum]|uniref:plastocyanin/azurin family copper-binding protein n=1 Tax=Halosimplex marinum TaxID=3396620 RepID=UPI003F56909C
MDRRAFLGSLGGVAVATTLAGCGQGSADSGDYDVGMTTRKFTPAQVEVPPGTTVRWKNTSSHAHTVTAYEDGIPDDAEFWATGEFDSQAAAEEGWLGGNEGALYEGETYERTFETVGTHSYFCIPHEASGMVGTVLVSEDATAPGSETSTSTDA